MNPKIKFLFPVFLLLLFVFTACEKEDDFVEPAQENVTQNYSQVDLPGEDYTDDLAELESDPSAKLVLERKWVKRAVFSQLRSFETIEEGYQYIVWRTYMENVPSDDNCARIGLMIVIDKSLQTIEGIMTCFDAVPELNRKYKLSGNVIDPSTEKLILRVHGYPSTVKKKSKLEILNAQTLLDPVSNESNNTVEFFSWISN